LGPIFLFFSVAALFYWMAFRVFAAADCEFFGSKIALVIVPACAAFGNQAAAVFPLLMGSASLLIGFLSWKPDRKPGHRRNGRARN